MPRALLRQTARPVATAREPMRFLRRLHLWTLLWTLASSGLLLLVVALWQCGVQIQVLRQWQPVTAEVVQSTRIGPAARINTYHLTLRYTHAGQHRTTHESRSSVGFVPQSTVTAYLDPGRPWAARVYSFSGFWLLPMVLGCAGSLLLWAAWALVRRPRPH